MLGNQSSIPTLCAREGGVVPGPLSLYETQHTQTHTRKDILTNEETEEHHTQLCHENSSSQQHMSQLQTRQRGREGEGGLSHTVSQFHAATTRINTCIYMLASNYYYRSCPLTSWLLFVMHMWQHRYFSMWIGKDKSYVKHPCFILPDLTEYYLYTYLDMQ